MVVVIKPSYVVHEDDKSRPTTIFSLDVSPDGSRLATAGLDQKIKIWSTEPILDEEKEADESCKKLLSTLGSHNGNVLCVRWSPDGQYLASGSDDFIAIIWEKDENAYGRKVFGQAEENHEVWKPVRRLIAHESDVMALAWSDDSYYLATGGSDRVVMVWETHTYTIVKRIFFHEGMVKGIAFDPVGELLATQSDDRSVCVWKTTDWSLVAQIKDPFVDSPNASWFRRLSWSPEGTFLAVPNSVNNGVFVAGIMKRRDWAQATSLIGHDNVVDVTTFNPVSFVKNSSKPATGTNLCAVLAIAARNCISIWLTSQIRPVVVFDTIVDRETLDLSWSRDGSTLYASSSEGHIAVMKFELSELGNPAPPGARESFLESWRFQRAPRNGIMGNKSGGTGGGGGTAERPNMLMVKKGKTSSVNTLLPIPPPGAPQIITKTRDGKRRIQPAFLGLGGIVAQPLISAASSMARHVPSSGTNTSTAAVFQPDPMHASSNGDVDMAIDMRTQAPLTTNTAGSSRPALPQQQRTSLQDIGLPSWGAPQERPVQHTQHARKRKAAELDHDEDMELVSLAPHRPPGRTLGGDRPLQQPPSTYDGDVVELRPAYLPKTITYIPSEALELAVPNLKAFQSLKWDNEDEDAERLECRNFTSSSRASEVSQINAKGKVQWLDYLSSGIVSIAFSPYFAALSCEDKSLHVYSPTGRRIMPIIILDGPCAFLDGAGTYLLAITTRGTLAVYDTRFSKASFRPTSIYPLLASTSPSTAHSHPPPIIVTAKIRPNGCPVISLSNGTALAYEADLQSWIEVSSTWWSKGSDCWEGRIRTSSASAGRGIVKIMESEVNDYLLAEQRQQQQEQHQQQDGIVSASIPVNGGQELPPSRESLEGQEQEKLGNADDWKVALTLGHLESRMTAAVLLDSLIEYKTFLSLYAKKLAEEAFRGKAEELVKELLGPVYYRVSRRGGGGGGGGREEEEWQPMLLATHKHTLLREILSIWGKTKNFSKLASDTSDILKKMAADSYYYM